jgi:hypothetical protein
VKPPGPRCCCVSQLPGFRQVLGITLGGARVCCAGALAYTTFTRYMPLTSAPTTSHLPSKHSRGSRDAQLNPFVVVQAV